MRPNTKIKYPGDVYSDTPPSVNWSDEERDRHICEWNKSPLMAMEYFRPHNFQCELAPFHYEMEEMSVKCIDFDPEYSHIAFIIPRNHGKSTFINGLVLWAILFEKADVILYIGADPGKVELEVEEIRFDLANNKRIKALFGDLLTYSGEDRIQYKGIISRKDLMVLRNGTVLKYTGLYLEGGKFPNDLRGFKARGKRPSLTIWDDPESPILMTPTGTQKFLDWRATQVHPALTVNHREIVAATKLDDMAWSNRIRFDTQWKTIFETCWEEGKYEEVPRWQGGWTKEALLQRKTEAMQQGLLHRYYQEYENHPMNPENAPYQQHWIHYHDCAVKKDQNILYLEGSIYNHKKEKLKSIKQPVKVIITVDPAVSDSKDSDFFASIVLASDGLGNHYFLDFIWDKGTNWVEIAKKIINQYYTLQASAIYIEDANIQRALKQCIQEIDSTVRVFVRRPLVRDKFNRIMSMQAYWQTGRVAIPFECPYQTTVLKNEDGSIKEFAKSLNLTEIFVNHLLTFRPGHKTHNLDLIDAASFAMEINKPMPINQPIATDKWYDYAFRHHRYSENIVESSAFTPLFSEIN